ncbi:major facilitator superfamily domain-containing protein [Kalaharituber pfeilii]|nr:major facilitator superfamily domain-containing protein [Kalaharituber pfeilii]
MFSLSKNGGYGWVCVLCVFFVNACTWGLNSAYGIYLTHYLNQGLHPSATSYHYAFIGGLSISTSMLVGPIVAFLFRHGWTTQHIMFLGILFQVASLIGASFAVHSLGGLFVSQGVLFGIGLGLLYTSSIGTISQWFSSKRSIANGLAAAGSGVGGIAFSIGINAAIEQISLAWSFRVTAICVCAVNILVTLLIRDRNASIHPTHNSFDIDLLRRIPNLGFVLAWGFFSLLGYVMILFSLADYARSIGLTTGQASIVASMLSLGMMFGRPLVGYMSDVFGRINISFLMTLFSGVTVFCLWMPGHLGGYPLCIVFAIINGAVSGTFWTTISPVATEIVGLKELPSALSVVWLSTVIPTTFSEAIGLALRRPELLGTGGAGEVYLFPQIFSGAMYIAATVVMGMLRWRMVRRKQRGEEEEGELGEKGNEGSSWEWVRV